MSAATQVLCTRDQLKQRANSAWALYADLCHYAEATDKDRGQAFTAALNSELRLMDHDHAEL